MKKKILVTYMLSAIATQNVFAKNDFFIQNLDPATEISSVDNQLLKDSQIQGKTNVPTIDELNKKLHNLSNQLEKILSKVKNKKDQKILVQLVQKIQTAEASGNANSSNNKNISKNKHTLRRDIFDVLKNLTTQTAIVAYAAIICLAITKKIFDTGDRKSVV